MSTAKETLDTVVKHLDSNSFKYDLDNEEMMIHLIWMGEDLPQPTLIHVDEIRDVVHIVSPIPGTFSEDDMVNAAIAVAAANNGMVNGNFQINMEDGTITFHITQYFKGGDFTDDDIHYLLSMAFSVTDLYNEKFFMLGRKMITLEEFLGQIQ